jgi:hypothetical protein
MAVEFTKIRFLNRPSGMMGSSARRSTATKAAAATTRPAPNAQVSGESQPSSFLPPKSVKKMRHVVAAESSRTPRISIRFSAGDGGEAEDGAQVLAAVLGRNDVGDDGLREDHQAAAAQTLDGAEDHKVPEIGGEGAAHRGEGEQCNGHKEQVAAAQDVTELAVDGHHDGGGQQVGGGDPGLVLHAAELPHDGGHRGGDDGLVQAGEEHSGDQGREDDPDAFLGQQQRLGCCLGTDGGAHWCPSAESCSGRLRGCEKSSRAEEMFSSSRSW